MHNPAHFHATFSDRRRGPVAERIALLANDLISLNAEQDASRARLLELGWPQSFLDTYLPDARAKANDAFVREIGLAPADTSRSKREQMASIIFDMLPTTQLIVAALQAHGVSTRDIDLHLSQARATAALAFAKPGAH